MALQAFFFLICITLFFSFTAYTQVQAHFTTPYSAKEMGSRAMEFPHTPLWSCLLIDIGTTVTADGFLDQQVATSAILALPHPDAPGQERFRWISQSVNSPDPEDTAVVVQIGYHTGKNIDVALTTFFPRPG